MEDRNDQVCQLHWLGKSFGRKQCVGASISRDAFEDFQHDRGPFVLALSDSGMISATRLVLLPASKFADHSPSLR
jgi:hypothetical protein